MSIVMTVCIIAGGDCSDMRIMKIDLQKPVQHTFPVIACIGYFDGMHKGHQALIEKTISMARDRRCDSGLITFDPDPWITLKKEQHVTHINTMRQRINLAARMGIQNIIILNFTEEMSRLSPAEFTDRVLSTLNLKGLVCGFDFRYGYKGEGNSETLAHDALCRVTVVEPVTDANGKISTSRISEQIMAGNVAYAADMLGYYYEIQGKVVHGRHRGHDLGFPTANVSATSEYIKPKPGVYAGYAVVHGRRYRAMINLGHNPTMNYRDDLSMEAYILDFNMDIYGERISIEFVRYLRPEVRFRTIGNLIMQLEQDARDVRNTIPL